MVKQEKIQINSIPAIIWGEKSDKAFIHVHGKMSRKEYAESFAKIAEEHGYQTISFYLPQDLPLGKSIHISNFLFPLISFTF